MGIDTYVRLPDNVQVRTVAEVIGKLIGLPAHKESLNGAHGAWAVRVDRIQVRGSELQPEVVIIETIKTEAIEFWATYHFEPSDGGRLLILRARAERIALARRLVDFFGGTVDYNDCDDVEVDYRKPAKSDKKNRPQHGKEWQDLEQRVFDLEPLTQDEIDACEKYAAYPSAKRIAAEQSV